MSIEAGDELVGDFPVADKYGLKDAGDYQVALRTSILGKYEGSSEAFAVDCGQGTLHLTESDPGLGTIQEPLHAYSAGCAANQIDIINSMDAVAQRAAFIAKQQVFASSPLYARWFGVWKSANATTVQGYVSRYNNLDWEVRCGGDACCDDPRTIGCMDPQTFGTDRIYMCNPFYGEPNSVDQQQSKVGTLVHEHTHLDASNLGGTDDIRDLGSCGGDCYGYQNALNLAQDPTCTASNPVDCKAINNAENYAFFTVNALNVTIATAAL